jgi:hypothetical protein
MIYDLVPQKIDAFFSKDEYEFLYKICNDSKIEEFLNKQENPTYQDGTPLFKNIEDVGYCAFSAKWPEFLTNKIKHNFLNLIEGVEDFELHCHFARYTNKSGAIPQLKPHYDIGLKNLSYTFSVQLNTNIENWYIYVNDHKYNMNSNEAILFSGTHQIHYRSKANFKDDSYCDILVCQLVSRDNILDDIHYDRMNNEAGKYVELYDKDLLS